MGFTHTPNLNIYPHHLTHRLEEDCRKIRTWRKGKGETKAMKNKKKIRAEERERKKGRETGRRRRKGRREGETKEGRKEEGKKEGGRDRGREKRKEGGGRKGKCARVIHPDQDVVCSLTEDNTLRDTQNSVHPILPLPQAVLHTFEGTQKEKTCIC